MRRYTKYGYARKTREEFERSILRKHKMTQNDPVPK